MNLTNIILNATRGFDKQQFINAYQEGIKAASKKFQTLIIASFISFLVFFIANTYLRKIGFDPSTNKGAFFIDESDDIKYALLTERVSFVVHFAIVSYLLIVQFVPNWYVVF